MKATDGLPAGYKLVVGPPDVDSYLNLRASAGLTPRRRDQAVAGLPGSWTVVHVVHEPSGISVGMGRVIGDGGLNFEVVDMAVLPEHQRLGLGDVILSFLLDRIREAAPSGVFVSLLADPPGRALYARYGFHETSPVSVGMAMVLGQAPTPPSGRSATLPKRQ
jgi:GNAT superfamily N-acetyltransferase